MHPGSLQKMTLKNPRLVLPQLGGARIWTDATHQGPKLHPDRPSVMGTLPFLEQCSEMWNMWNIKAPTRDFQALPLDEMLLVVSNIPRCSGIRHMCTVTVPTYYVRTRIRITEYYRSTQSSLEIPSGNEAAMGSRR